MTLARYYMAVAAVYFVVWLGIDLLLVGAGAEPISARLLLLPVIGAAFGVFFTAVAIARFGNLGGSVYFSPTMLHVFLLLVVAFLAVREFWR